MENRREHTRYRVAITAEIEFEGDTLIGETRDISDGGVSVILKQALEEGGNIELTLLLTQDGIEDAHEEPFETEANVMWATATDEGKAMIGLRFGSLPSNQSVRLERFLQALNAD